MRTAAQPTTSICPTCGGWNWITLHSYLSPAHEYPCQLCGSIYRLGDDAPAESVSYWHWYRALHGQNPVLVEVEASAPQRWFAIDRALPIAERMRFRVKVA